MISEMTKYSLSKIPVRTGKLDEKFISAWDTFFVRSTQFQGDSDYLDISETVHNRAIGLLMKVHHEIRGGLIEISNIC